MNDLTIKEGERYVKWEKDIEREAAREVGGGGTERQRWECIKEQITMGKRRNKFVRKKYREITK